MNLIEKDRQYLWHPYTQHKTAATPIAIVKGEGALLWDEYGNEYLDAIASWWVNPFGHSNKIIADAIYHQLTSLEHVLFGGFTHEPAITVAEKLLPLLPASWHEEIYYFIEDEFANKVKIDGVIHKTFSNEEISARYNADEFSPVDGKILKICDHLAAYIEASLSIQHGMKSQHLEEACQRLHNLYRDKVVAGINFGQVFDYYYSN